MQSDTKKIDFIVNPIAGGRSKKRIIETLERFRRGYGEDRCRILFTERAGHAEQLASESEADIVVAVGGDGTVSEVAHGLVGSAKALGIVPCGSGDGLALHLGISRRPKKALRTLEQMCIVPMDYATVNGEPFFCTCGVGFDAETAYAFTRSGKRGLWTYISMAWKVYKTFNPQEYSIVVDGQPLTAAASIITAGNANQWGNQARITSLASVSDGLTEVVIVKPFSLWEMPLLAFQLMTGIAHKSHKTICLRGWQITIRRGAEGAAHRDGDPLMMGSEIEINTFPAGLNVVVPPSRSNRI